MAMLENREIRHRRILTLRKQLKYFQKRRKNLQILIELARRQLKKLEAKNSEPTSNEFPDMKESWGLK